MAKQEIIIIGAGYAGVHAAQKLAKKYKKDENVSITLIDRHSYHTMMTELHEVAAHRVEPEAIQFDLRRLFNRSKVKLVTDNVTHVDYKTNVVTTEHGSYPFDHLILGMGGEPNDFNTPGVKEFGFTLWSFEDAVRLRRHIEETVYRASLEHDPVVREGMLTFTVCGSGFTGVEMVGELIEWKERLAKNNKLDKEDITLYLVEAAPTILNTIDRKSADKAEAYMTKKGVKIIKNAFISEVKENLFVLKSEEEIASHTVVWTAGVKGSTDTDDFGMKKARSNRIQVNEFMEAEGLENVYVVGDLAYFEEKEGEATPQIVEAAEQTAITAAKNIIAKISGGEKDSYEGKYHGNMVSIGARYGVANLNGIKLSGWFAIFMKHMVNLYYFFGIRSGYYMWRYVEHEFFHTKDKRNIFRGLLTQFGNVLWAVPLRVYLGVFWLIEGAKKFWGETAWAEATSSISSLPTLFRGIGEDSWITSDNVNMPFEWLQDPASAATADASAWTTPILSDMFFWFEWIMRIMMPTPEIAVLMQKMVVFVELGLGLALIAGLFTFIGGAVSAGFIAMFTLTAMLGWDQFWVLPASIAIMAGAGRALGLDYYVIPFIWNKFSDWWYGKERSIYTFDNKK